MTIRAGVDCDRAGVDCDRAGAPAAINTKTAAADPAKTVFYQSAILARAWLDPEPEMSERAFKNMIASIRSGARATNDALRDAELSLNTSQ